MIKLEAHDALWINRAVSRSLQILAKEGVENSKVKLLRSIHSMDEEHLAPLAEGKVTEAYIKLTRGQAMVLAEMAEASIAAITTAILPEYDKREAAGADMSKYRAMAHERLEVLPRLVQKLRRVK